MIIGSRRILTSLLLFVFLAFTAVAQEMPNPQDSATTSKKDEVRGPRAVAVLEWTAQGPRLIPVAIKIDQQFYDASLYMAQPVPMALENGVIYEVQKAGDPLGDFTLSEAEQTPGGLWLGVGKFDSKADQDKRKAAVAKRKEAEAKEKAKEEKDELGTRPVLRRSPKASTPPPDGGPDKTETKPQTTAPSSPAPGTAPGQTAGSQVPAASTGAAPELSAASPAPARSSDSGRPILRRGKPAQEQAESINEKIAEKKPVPPPPGMGKLEVAVSDASKVAQHSYKWTWANPDEQQKIQSQAEKLALATLADYAKKTNGPVPGALQDAKIEAYDLSYSNAATVILSARVLPQVRSTVVRRGAKRTATEKPTQPSDSSATPAFEYYVTVVGREDIYGQLQQELTFATDNKHLDAFPRMQLVDVVDADGNGNGDLLFDSISDNSNAFVIYRDTGWRLEKLIQVPAPKV